MRELDRAVDAAQTLVREPCSPEGWAALRELYRIRDRVVYRAPHDPRAHRLRALLEQAWATYRTEQWERATSVRSTLRTDSHA